MLRITPCPLGAIKHRPTTRLSRPKLCSNGHHSPAYESGNCVICNKEKGLERYERRPSGRSRKMRLFRDYTLARRTHENEGGFLVRVDKNLFGVTDSDAVAARMRGKKWVEQCYKIECWDEVEMEAHTTSEQWA